MTTTVANAGTVNVRRARRGYNHFFINLPRRENFECRTLEVQVCVGLLLPLAQESGLLQSCAGRSDRQAACARQVRTPFVCSFQPRSGVPATRTGSQAGPANHEQEGDAGLAEKRRSGSFPSAIHFVPEPRGPSRNNFPLINYWDITHSCTEGNPIESPFSQNICGCRQPFAPLCKLFRRETKIRRSSGSELHVHDARIASEISGLLLYGQFAREMRCRGTGCRSALSDKRRRRFRPGVRAAGKRGGAVVSLVNGSRSFPGT